MEMEVKAKFRSRKRLAEIPFRIGLCDGVVQSLGRQMILPTQKDVADLCVDGIAGEDHAFDQAMRIALHQHTILKRARFHFIGIGHDILRFRRIGPHRDEAPLGAGRKSTPAPAAQSRFGHQPLHILGSQPVGEPLKAAIPAVFDVLSQCPRACHPDEYVE